MDWLFNRSAQTAPPAARRSRIIASQLESRLLLSAAPVSISAYTSAPEVQPLEMEHVQSEDLLSADVVGPSSAEDQSTPQTVSQAVVFVDSSLPNLEELLKDLEHTIGVEGDLSVVVLDAHRDGIEQIGEALALRTGIDAVHLVSHGSSGGVRVGNAWLTADNLASYAGTIAAWGDALGESADVLIYGCDLAASSSGQRMIEALSQLTGADVAASNDLTGHAALGADWDLEFVVGVVDTEVVFSRHVQATWISTLGVYLDDFDDLPAAFNGNDGTLSWTNDWQDFPEGDGPLLGKVFIDTEYGEQGLKVGRDQEVWRQADLSGATTATLSFDYALINLEGGDLAVVEASTDGVVWNTVGAPALTSPLASSQLVHVSYDISAYIDSDTRIRFGNNFNQGNDYLFVDNVQIVLTGLPTNADPTADATGGQPYAINEGDSISLHAGNSSDSDGTIVSYEWDLDNDSIFGEPGESTGVNPTVSWATLQAFGIVDDGGPYTIGLRVTDDLGGTDTTTTTLMVNNTAPTLTATGAPTVNDGALYTLNLNASDPGDDTITSWTVNWGDGAIETISGNPSSVTHSYSGVGMTYNVLISATDGDGTYLLNEMLVASYTSGNSIFRYEGTTGAFLEEFDTSNGLDDPIDVIIGPDGRLYVSGENSDNVLRYNAVTGAFIDEFVTDGSGGLNSPGGLAFGPDGNLYVASWNTDEILRYDGTTGAFIDAFVPAGSGGLRQAYGLVFGPDGNLYVNSYNDDQVLRYDGTTGAFIDTFVSPGSGGLSKPEQMVFGPDGNLYIASFDTNEVLRYDGTTGAFIDDFVSAGLGGLDRPAGLAFGPDGQLYVADNRDGAVLRYHGMTGAFIDEYVTPGSGGLDTPTFINFLPQHQVTVTPGNVAPTITLTPAVSNLNEDVDTSNPIVVANFAISDDGQGTNTLSLSGADAALFQISGNNIELIAGASLDFETNPILDVTVNVDDATIPLTPDDSASHSVTLNDIDEAPTTSLISDVTLLADGATGAIPFTVGDPETGAGSLVVTARSSDQAIVPDANLIVGGSGASRTITVTPAAGQTGTVTVTVDVFDGTNSTQETFLVTVVPRVITVTTTADELDGDTSDILALMGNQGGTGISLREAIAATNNTLLGTTPDEIHFNLANNDLGHLYYQENGAAGFAAPTVTSLADAAIVDFDTDYPYAQHSWFRIDVSGGPSQLTVTDQVIIDGYTQTGATQNSVAIGHDAALRIELTNTGSDGFRGLTFDAGSDGSTLRGLAINGFDGIGVMVNHGVDDVTVQGNFIGTDITGTVDVANIGGGIQIRGDTNLIGGANSADRNVISGAQNRGVAFFSGGTLTGNVIENNYIGVDATGLARLGNANAGIQVYNSDAGIIRGNVISGNAGHGIWFRDIAAFNTNNVIQGNYIGMGADGTTVIANDNNGISIETGNGNLIGGPGTNEGNVISGNLRDGIEITDGSSNNTIQGNLIGVDAGGTLNRGNNENGISIVDGSDNVIGGTGAGEGNIIAHSVLFHGVEVQNGSGNAIRGNSIFLNAGLGIELGTSGVVDPNDSNDADGGPNQRQNYPVLTLVEINGGSVTVNGSLHGAASSIFQIDFYASPAVDPSSHGEARRYLGSTSTLTDSSGNAPINVVLAATVSAGEFITATATDSAGNTSEFSLSLAAVLANAAPTIAMVPLITNLDEDADTLSPIVVATFSISDDGVGTNLLTLSGADAGLFQLNGMNIELVAGAALDFESNAVLDFNLNVDDASILGSPEDSVSHAITINDINEAPTLALTPVITALDEDANTSSPLVVATFAINDDSAGTNNLSLSGADAMLFQINGANLELVAGALLDFASNPVLNVNVDVDDPALAGSPEDSVAHAVTINDINSSPVNTVPGLQTVPEATATPIGGISVTDADVGAGLLTTRLEVSNGVLNLTLSGGAVISNGTNGSGDLTVQGNLSDLNATLASLQYTGNVGVSGISADTLTVTTDDGGNSGLPGSLQDVDTVQIDITSFNVAPVLSVPGAQSPSEDLLFAITGVSVADVDAGAASIQVRFSVSQGTLMVNSTVPGGLTTNAITNNGTRNVLVTAPIAQLNATLADATGLVYLGNADFSGLDALVITADDLGNSGGGPAGVDSRSIALNVAPVNDAPVASGDAFAALSNGPLTITAPDLLINDADIDSASLTWTLVTGPSHGTATLNPDGSVTYVADAGFVGTDSFTYQASDGALNSPLTLVSLTVAPPPAPPTTLPEAESGNSDTEADASAELTEPTLEDASQVTAPPPTTTSPDTSQDRTRRVASTMARKVNVVKRVIESAPEPSRATPVAARSTGRAESAANVEAEVTRSVTRPSLAVVAETAPIWHELDTLGEQVEADLQIPDLMIGGTAGAASALSVGYVVWLLKGGHILAGILAQMPAWKMIDPLPILAQLDEDEDDDEQEDDDLRSLFDTQAPDDMRRTRRTNKKANETIPAAGLAAQVGYAL